MPHKIKEIIHCRDALTDIHFNTWLILDLDNTVMTSSLELGGDAWFSGLFGHLAQKQIDSKTALPWILSVYNAVQHFVRTEAVEKDIILIIKALQDIGIPVIGLTARGYAIRHQTFRQLADMGVDFSKNSLVEDNGYSSAKGIIFCGGKDKGEQLHLFFKELLQSPNDMILPRHVTMLDDKKNHLEHVSLALSSLGIRFSGFRYAYLDEQVKQFDMEKATIQLAHLWEWLSPEAKEDISHLGLIPSPLQGTLSPSKYAIHFFHPEDSLYLLKNQASITMLKELQRKCPQTTDLYPDFFTQLTKEASTSISELLLFLEKKGLGALSDHALSYTKNLFDRSGLDYHKKAHFQQFLVVAQVLANPLSQTIFEARLRVFSEYSEPFEPLRAKDAETIIQEVCALDNDEARIQAFFNFFAKFRPLPGSQKYLVELDMAEMVTRELLLHCDTDMLNTLKSQGGNRALFEKIKYSIAASIESEDMCSIRSYEVLMEQIWEELAKPQVHLGLELEALPILKRKRTTYSFSPENSPKIDKDNDIIMSEATVEESLPTSPKKFRRHKTMFFGNELFSPLSSDNEPCGLNVCPNNRF